MIDVAGWKGVDALPSNYAISPKDLQAALARQNMDIEPGDVVLIRTGTCRYWEKPGPTTPGSPNTIPPASPSSPPSGWWNKKAR
jgi:hypothetical protein